MRTTAIMMLLTFAATLFTAGTAGAAKIYLNPSDQIHNMSPDNSYCEADAMKDVAKRLEAKLAARGFEVQNSDGKTMADSCSAANAWPADIFVSLHSNAGAGPGWGKAHGTNTLYYQSRDGSPPNPISIELAIRCDEKVVEKMKTYGRDYDFAITADLPFLGYPLYVLRKTEMPGTLVEGLFHDNMEDTAVLKTEEGRDAYAQGVYEALCDHFNMSYYADAPILDADGPVANDSEGRLVFAVRDEKGNVKVLGQSGVNGAWNAEWTDLEGAITSEPKVARNAQGRLHVFATGPGGRIVHKVQSSAGSDRWNGWYDLGGSGDPVVAKNADGRLIVFAVSPDGHLRCRMQTSATSPLQWSGWTDLGAGFQGDPLVHAQADGRLVVVCSAGTQNKWAVQEDGSKWSKWQAMEDHAEGNVCMARDGKGRLVLFAGGGGHVLYRTLNGSEWGAWQDIEGNSFGNFAAGVTTDGRFEVFAIDPEGALSRNSQGSDEKWSGWQPLGTNLAGYPTAARNKDGRLVLFARNKDGKTQYRVQREPGRCPIYDGWYTLGEKPVSKGVRQYPPAKK